MEPNSFKMPTDEGGGEGRISGKEKSQGMGVFPRQSRQKAGKPSEITKGY